MYFSPSRLHGVVCFTLFPDSRCGRRGCSCHCSTTADHPLAVKVVILTTFEIGADTGDTPGEFQYWVERRNLNIIIPMKMGYHDIRTDGNCVIGTVTGMGTANAATSVMALATDPRFDFSKAYWILAGIAGIDPQRGSLASAVWADCVVDGDVAYEIDGREIPANWSTGVIPWERTKPFEGPPPTDIKQIYILNRDLVNRAYNDTKEHCSAGGPGHEEAILEIHRFSRNTATA